MPPGPFAGFDKQSDREAALFLSPYFLLLEEDVSRSDCRDGDDGALRIPWSLRGSLLMNLLGALVQSSVMHRRLTRIERVENAFTAHVLLDLGQMLAFQREEQFKLRRQSCFLASATKTHLQELCAGIVIACKECQDVIFKPWHWSEMPVEQWFGLIRSQFRSSQVSVRDYLLASVRTCEQFMDAQMKLMKFNEDQAHCPESNTDAASTSDPRLSDQDLAHCADRAFAAAIDLMSAMSSASKPFLRRSYMAFTSLRIMEEGDEDEVLGPKFQDNNFHVGPSFVGTLHAARLDATKL